MFCLYYLFHIRKQLIKLPIYFFGFSFEIFSARF